MNLKHIFNRIAKYGEKTCKAANPESVSTYLVEKALEGYDVRYLAKQLNVVSNSSKALSNAIIVGSCIYEDTLSKEERVNKHINVIIQSLVYLGKEGLSEETIEKALAIGIQSKEDILDEALKRKSNTYMLDDLHNSPLDELAKLISTNKE